MNTYLRPILIVMLLLCLAPMPYGYYEIVRVVAMVIFGAMAYGYHEARKDGLMVTCGVLAVLFQPFFKIALGRTMWNIVDVAVAALLIVIMLKERKEKEE
ncbi:MAG: hypothetical protein IJ355_06585 [Prevotella sp.]|nr:hypothetical protein [Prevotella sp.]